MKTMKYFLAATLALATLWSCSKEPESEPEEGKSDAYYAALASVSSSDSNFIASEEGGIIYFKAEGGQVAVEVDCGTTWSIENTASDLFSTTVNGSTVTVTAGQSDVEAEQTGSISFYTATSHLLFATVSIVQDAYGAPDISVDTNEWKAPAKGELSVGIAVECSLDDYEVEISDNWLSYDKTDSGITLTATENGDTDSRSTRVIVSASDGIRTQRETISVTQDGLAYITPNVETVGFYSGGGSKTVAIESNFDWDFSYETSNGWYSIERDGEALKVTVSEYDGEDDREGTVTLTAGDGAENVVEIQITIVQHGPQPQAMILTYTVSANTKIYIPLYGTVNCTVDWGDGSETETVTSTQPSHTYADAGSYDVVIDGTVTALYSPYNKYSTSTDPYLTDIKQFGQTGLTDLNKGFFRATKMTSITATNTDNSFENVTTFEYVFAQCIALEEVPAGLFGDCPNATCFTGVLQQCLAFKEVPAGLFDGCPKANTFEQCFFYDPDLTKIPAGLFDNCPDVTSFRSVFANCSITEIPEGLFDHNTKVTSFRTGFTNCQFTKIPEGLFDKCTEAEDFYIAFRYCDKLTEVPDRLFANTKAKDLTNIFAFCTSLASIPSGLFANCTEATSFTAAFAYCPLTSIPKGLFDDCTSATDFNTLFQGAEIKSIPEGLFDKCTKVTDYTYVFNACPYLESVPEGLFDSAPDITSAWGMFQNCPSLKSLPAGLFSKNTKITNFSYAFDGCTALSGESPYTELEDGSKIHFYERTAALGFADVTTGINCFYGCKGLSDYDAIPTVWGGGGHPDVSGVVGTYTATALVYGQGYNSETATWDMTLYKYDGTEGYDLYVEGITPWGAGGYATYGDYRTAALAYYEDGKIVVPSQCSSTMRLSTNGTNYYLGYTPCISYSNGNGNYSASFPDCVFSGNETTGSWESNYGMLMVGCTTVGTISSLAVSYQIVAPTIKLEKKSSSTSAADVNRPAMQNLEFYTNFGKDERPVTSVSGSSSNGTVFSGKTVSNKSGMDVEHVEEAVYYGGAVKD